MNETLIIFGKNRSACDEYLKRRDNNSYYYDLIIADDIHRIRGLGAVDIIFTYGWWERKDADEILKALKRQVVYSIGSQCLGEDKYLPPYLSEYFNKVNEKGYFGYSIEDRIESRFEILDI